MFAVQVTQEAQGTVFTLRGDLDFESTVQLQEAGGRELANGQGAGAVVADCTDLAFCDSSGINALLRLFQQLAAQDRSLRLACVPVPVARVFTLTGLDQVFCLHADVAEALAADPSRPGIAVDGTEDPARSSEGHHV
ncbi:STAS domain-containing protein [Streptomyces sp. H39-S7]|uniref:STAS domain-containing protein n=1 Tax=Streptomyces sp. H39-S7 TaxID=3004357 RepID=UPI0022AF5DDE|nr:STAS domain-containing protein [Streptomyces sp. H39-S7]MCZ4126089.1 STAS domain-containing protein [Streptomyces sp. H39-S7]